MGLAEEAEYLLYIITGECLLIGFSKDSNILLFLDRHDGYGYQTSWGCAIKVVELLEQALAAD